MLVELVVTSSVVLSSSSLMVDSVVVGVDSVVVGGRGSTSRGIASLSDWVCSEKAPSVSVNISSFTSRLMARLIELTMCWFCREPRDWVTSTERRTSPVSTTLVLAIMLPLLLSSPLSKLLRISFLL